MNPSPVRSLTLPLLALALASCSGGGGSSAPSQGLILSKSLFKKGAQTQPSTLEIVSPPSTPDGAWTSVVIQDDPTVEILAEFDDKEVFPGGGNVLHKAFWFDPVHGEPGILSISANAAWMKMWRKSGGTWQPEELWHGVVGGKENRLRDVEVADVDGDGQDELVVVTHDHGLTYVFEQTPEGMVPTEVGRADDRTFIHEVEVGDIDGDGVAEFMTTPSAPNKFEKGASQPGGIHLFQYEDGKYVESVVMHDEHRHAKEILCADLDRSGTPELYSALETHDDSETLEIHRYEWDAAQNKMVGGLVIALPGKMCRFLNVGDTNGDGQLELIASTRSQGILRIQQDGNEWRQSVIAGSYLSGGFEHATVVFDYDGDGMDDVLVASDQQKSLNRFFYRPEYDSYDPEELLSWRGGDSYLTWNIMPLPLD